LAWSVHSPERKRIVQFIAIMMAVCAVSGGGAIRLLYDAAFDAQRARLTETVRAQSRLLEAIGANTPEVASGKLPELVLAHFRQEDFGQTGELMVARLEGDRMVYIVTERDGDQHPGALPLLGSLGEPMRRALEAQTGTMIGPDYRGVTVLAAHQPVQGLGWGIVAKIDLAEVRRPFVRAAALGAVLALFAIIVATMMFARMSESLVAKLTESEARMRSIVDTAVDSIITIDRTGSITTFNQAAVRLFGWTTDEIIGARIEVLMPEPHRSAHHAYLSRFLETGERRIIGIGREVVGQRKDGSTFPMELAVSEVRRAGEVEFTGIVRDLSERKRAEQRIREINHALEETNKKLVEEQAKLVQAEKLSSIGLLAAGVAHEINNPLSGVMACVKALRAESVPPGRRAEYFDTVKEGLERIGAIVRDLLDFARQRPPAFGPLDAGEVVDACLRLLAPAVRTKDAVVDNQVARGSVCLEADRSQLMQGLMNVVLNAVQATPPGGRVEISGLRVNGRAGLRITDHGAGIPRELLARVRDPFFTTKAPGQGTGLGLAVTDSIVRTHGGEMEIESEEGRGTTVTLWLPVKGAAHV
jgi:two-component system, LuxR family, sensor kinase FixL